MLDFSSIIVCLCSELFNGGQFVNFFFGRGGGVHLIIKLFMLIDLWYMN